MASTQSLPTELSFAIRSSHIQLNRLITARLPLCLPPHSAKPTLYLQGMLVFSHLYTAIEEAWDQILQDRGTDARILDILQTLQTPGLQRSERLNADLAIIEKRLVGPDNERLQDIHNATQHYQQDLHNLLVGRPHLLLAWSWNMYLAIFNGGRYIRQSLRDAGENYWGGEPQLTFWEFDGESDGEDIKTEFKKNIDIASQCLTKNEWAEVVSEAKRVMAVCQEMVEVLDRWFPTPEVNPGRLPAKAMRISPVTTAPTTESMSIYVMVVALLGGLWHAVLQVLSFGKGFVRPNLDTTKEVHLD